MGAVDFMCFEEPDGWILLIVFLFKGFSLKNLSKNLPDNDGSVGSDPLICWPLSFEALLPS